MLAQAPLSFLRRQSERTALEAGDGFVGGKLVDLHGYARDRGAQG
jgi:hypothetical protein